MSSRKPMDTRERYWSGSGEQPASMKIFDLENNNFKSFKLEEVSELTISDFDSNGKPDIIVDNHSGAFLSTPFSTFMNIDENSSCSSFQ